MWILEEKFLCYRTQKFFLLTTTRKIFCYKTNLREVLEIIKIPKNLAVVTCEQVHGNKIVFLKQQKICRSEFINLANSDGCITDSDKVAICIFTADCVPLFLYNEKENIYGLVHIGRKGVLNGIVENVVKLLTQHWCYKNFKFVLGPHICEKCYIVKAKDVKGSYCGYDTTTGQFSLKKEIIYRLRQYGIAKTQIITSSYCTYHNNEVFFSYRKGDGSNRLVSIIYYNK